MDTAKLSPTIETLMFDENEHLNKLHQIVKNSIEAEEMVIQNLLNLLSKL